MSSIIQYLNSELALKYGIDLAIVSLVIHGTILTMNYNMLDIL